MLDAEPFQALEKKTPTKHFVSDSDKAFKIADQDGDKMLNKKEAEVYHQLRVAKSVKEESDGDCPGGSYAACKNRGFSETTCNAC